MPLTQSTVEHEMDFPLRWAKDAVKYLGVWVHRDPEVVLQMNYGQAMSVLSERVAGWIRLPLSLADRIAVIKMNILPKFLYFFVNIPIILKLF